MSLAADPRTEAGLLPRSVALTLAALTAGALAACAAPRVGQGGLRAEPSTLTADGRIRVIGYNDMDEMLGRLTARFSKVYPHLRFALELPGTRAAPPALINGRSAFAPMGAELSDDDRAVYRARWGDEPIEVSIAHDSLTPGALSSPTGVFVHNANPLVRLEMREIRHLFAGRAAAPVKRWGDLGLTGVWRNRPVRIVGLGADTAIGQRMLRRHLRSSAFATGFDAHRQSRDVAGAVGGDEAAIGFANLNHGHAGIRALAIVDDAGREVFGSARDIQAGRYPFDRRLLVYARRRRDGTTEPVARAFLLFALSDAGQRIIAAGSKGYLPLSESSRREERAKLKR